MNKEKHLYKKMIREHKTLSKSKLSGVLEENLTGKNLRSFWKTWNNKVLNKTPVYPNLKYCDNSATSAVCFKEYFQKVSNSLNDEFVESCKIEFNSQVRTNCNYKYDNSVNFDLFTVTLVELCVSKINSGKAPGFDNLCIDNLSNAHPVLYLILARLFYLMLQYSYVPSDFGKGIIVPIPKDCNKLGVLSPSDYRGITLSPVISKVFEHAMLFLFQDCFSTSNHQFGFKKELSCCHAVYTVRKVVDFFTTNESNVNVCCLDISKAFDCVNHDRLFLKLLNRNIPLHFILMLRNWYGKLYSCVKWDEILSPEFKVNSGVRQGGVLSAFLFSIYVNDILVKLNNYGCFIKGISYGSLMYADDLVLMSSSFCELQCMINICYEELNKVGLSLNESKSFFMRFGKGWNNNVGVLRSPKGEIPRVLSGCYLGVDVVSGVKLTTNLYKQKCKFYASFNAIYSKIGCFNNEMVSLHLAFTIALPSLLYATEALNWNKTRMRELELPWTRAFMKVFKTYDINIIKSCQFYSGYASVEETINQRKNKFSEKLVKSNFILVKNLINI